MSHVFELVHFSAMLLGCNVCLWQGWHGGFWEDELLSPSRPRTACAADGLWVRASERGSWVIVVVDPSSLCGFADHCVDHVLLGVVLGEAVFVRVTVCLSSFVCESTRPTTCLPSYASSSRIDRLARICPFRQHRETCRRLACPESGHMRRCLMRPCTSPSWILFQGTMTLKALFSGPQAAFFGSKSREVGRNGLLRTGEWEAEVLKVAAAAESRGWACRSTLTAPDLRGLVVE